MLFSIFDNNTLLNRQVRLYFRGNRANFAGDALYGSDIDTCTFENSVYEGASSGKVFDAISQFAVQNDTSSIISSDAIQLCPCNGTLVQCDGTTNIISQSNRRYPGQIVSLNLVAVGQRNGSVPSPILAYYKDIDGSTQWLCA